MATSKPLSAQIKTLRAKYKAAKAAYYNDAPIMTDAQFDKLEDKLKDLDPTWAEFGKTGVKIKQKKVEVALEEFMPSLPKAYPEQLPKWLAKNGEIQLTMDKLDGSALFLQFVYGKPTKLVTRGDGVRGGDISFLIPHLGIPNIPALKTHPKVSMRCEAVMPRKAFTKKWAAKFENPRNMVNGILNRALEGVPHIAIKDIHVVVLGVYGMPLEKGLRAAKKHGLRTVPYAILTGPGTSHYEERLKLRKAHSDYDIDGLVLAPRTFKFGYTSADKPKGTIAFKVNNDADAKTVKVLKIIWQVTGHNRIIPKIKIEPTRIDGVMVEHATVHNARWMQDRSIGPGAVVKVLRSGGVIPKIVDVVKPGKFQPPPLDYKTKGVHFVVMNATAETANRVKALQMLKFVKSIGIEFLADKTITKVQGTLPSVRAWLTAWKTKKLARVLVTAGLGAVQARKIVAEFDRVFGRPVPALQLLVALHVFDAGVGERKLKAIQDSGMALNYLVEEADEDEITAIKGFSSKTARLVLEGCATFRKMQDGITSLIAIDWKIPKAKPKPKTGKLSGQVVSFTGYRDEDHEILVENAGGTVSTFGSKTTILVYKAGGKLSTKIDKAKAKGIKVLTFDKLGV